MNKLSIITINYNNKAGLIKTVESVINQTYQDYEYIVIDGGSTDGSVAYLEEQQAHFDYWVSEPDCGIFNAMNKGIKAAKGEYINFLNSGDFYINNKTLKDICIDKCSEDIVYGFTKSNHTNYSFPKQLTLRFFFKESLGHSSSFIKKELFLKYGLYREDLKISSDWAFFINAIMKEKCTYKQLDLYISFFEGGGISSNPNYFNVQKKERAEVFSTLFPEQYEDYNYLFEKLEELAYYQKSKLVQVAKKIQKSKIYRFLRK